MKITKILIIISVAVEIAGIILRWGNTFAGRFGIKTDYFLKDAVQNSRAYLLLLFIIPLILIFGGKLSKRNSIITVMCGIAATAVPLYFFINGDNSTGNIALLAAGAILTLAGILRLAGK
jgi:hypothetical protein